MSLNAADRVPELHRAQEPPKRSAGVAGALACRVCGDHGLIALPIGQYADFFRMRVDTTQDPNILYTRDELIRATPEKPSLVSRAYGKLKKMFSRNAGKKLMQFRTYMQFCIDCHAVTPCHSYAPDALDGLYSDYRSETYNRDRISVEPSYRKYAHSVGSHSAEVRNRNAAVARFLTPHRDQLTGDALLDVGGSDGLFLPDILYDSFDRADIFDVSDAPVHKSVAHRNVSKVAAPQPGGYSFATCMHVLEHVGNPKAFLEDALKYLGPGGFLYLEVPLELTSDIQEAFASRRIDPPIIIHEHMNRFDLTSMQRLAEALPGVELVDSAEDEIEIGWVNARIGRTLLRKLD